MPRSPSSAATGPAALVARHSGDVPLLALSTGRTTPSPSFARRRPRDSRWGSSQPRSSAPRRSGARRSCACPAPAGSSTVVTTTRDPTRAGGLRAGGRRAHAGALGRRAGALASGDDHGGGRRHRRARSRRALGARRPARPGSPRRRNTVSTSSSRPPRRRRPSFASRSRPGGSCRSAWPSFVASSPATTVTLRAPAGSLALDGEREHELGEGEAVEVTLDTDGPARRRRAGGALRGGRQRLARRSAGVTARQGLSLWLPVIGAALAVGLDYLVIFAVPPLITTFVDDLGLSHAEAGAPHERLPRRVSRVEPALGQARGEVRPGPPRRRGPRADGDRERPASG